MAVPGVTDVRVSCTNSAGIVISAIWLTLSFALPLCAHAHWDSEAVGDFSKVTESVESVEAAFPAVSFLPGPTRGRERRSEGQKLFVVQ